MLARRPNLYLFEGETGGGGGGGTGNPPAPPAPPAEGTPPPPEQKEVTWPEWDGKDDSLPEAIRAELTRLRGENSKGRVQAKTAAAREEQQRVISAIRDMLGEEAATQVSEALGAPAVDTRSPQERESAAVKAAQEERDKAAAEKSAAEEAAAAARAEAAVLRAAVRLGTVDVDALLDSREFAGTMATLDTSNLEAVQTHIKEYAQQHPRFLTGRVGTSTADPAAGSGDGGRAPRTVLSIAEAAERAYTAQTAR